MSTAAPVVVPVMLPAGNGRWNGPVLSALTAFGTVRCSLGWLCLPSLYRRFEGACLARAFGRTSGMHKRCAAARRGTVVVSCDGPKDLNVAQHFDDGLASATSPKVSGQVSRAIQNSAWGSLT